MEMDEYGAESVSAGLRRSQRGTISDNIPDNVEELDRRTVRKLDMMLLPFLALLFLFNSLDRSNIGNAEVRALFGNVMI
jgi:hypothetical protein